MEIKLSNRTMPTQTHPLALPRRHGHRRMPAQAIDSPEVPRAVRHAGRETTQTRQIALAITVVAMTTAIGAAFTILTLAPRAEAAPSRTDSAEETVKALQREGYKVILNRVGSLPLGECIVSAIRPGRQVTRTSSLSDDVVEEVLYTTIYVDARCDSPAVPGAS